MRRSGAFRELLLVTLALLGAVNVCVAGGPLVAPAGNSALQDKVTAAVARDMRCSLAALPDASDLQVLDPLLSLPSASKLRVTSVRAGYLPGSWLLRLDCVSRRDCLPFHVLLRVPAAGRHDDALTAKAGKVESSRLQTNSSVARSGDHVLLVEERSGMRLKVTAVCLQSGGLGDQIRVRNLATQRVLLATVAGKNLVRVE